MTALPTAWGELWVHYFGERPAKVVALHGFTLHGESFRTFAATLNESVAAPDLPGHGRTTIDPVSLHTAAEAISALLAQSANPPVLLGYSQGGRIALQVALAHPELISGLVVASTAAGLSEVDRKVRAVADDALAMRIERIGIERFIDEWLANPITATDRVTTAARTIDRTFRLENDSAGLAAALRGMGQATVPDLRDRLPGLEVPACFVAGKLDLHYAELAEEMASLVASEPVIIPEAGHNVILENPGAVAAAVSRLLTP